MLYKDALQQALERYEMLISKYKTPLDIPKNAWILGNDMEVGKWYLWVLDGGRYKTSNEISREQHIIMIPEKFNGKLQNFQDFDALWYLSAANQKLFDANYIDELYLDKENMQWHGILDLELELDSFGIQPTSYWVIGPLEELDMPLKSMDFLNWKDNPLP